MTRDRSTSAEFLSRFGTAVLLALSAAIYVAGATVADPGLGAGAADLDILRVWKATGTLTDHPTDASHLTKPGHLAYLRALLPEAGASPSENRRFLIVNATLVLAGIAAAALALAIHRRRLEALAFVLFAGLFLPLRDAADHLASEPLAIGLSLSSLAALLVSVHGQPLAWSFIAGAFAGLLSAMRPNLALLLMAVAGVASLAFQEMRALRLTVALCGFLLVVAAWAAALPALGYRRVSPANDVAKSLLWGTADYYWRWDVGEWPTGATKAETAALQFEKVRSRWGKFFRGWSRDRGRSLVWRLTHAAAACEELPPRWKAGWYVAVNKAVRRWWWVAAIGLVGLAIAVSISGRGAWRLVPPLILISLIGQGLIFGADPRLALPVIPMLVMSTLIVLPTVRWRAGSILAGVGAAAALALAVLSCPDSATSDYALVRGTGRSIRQRVSAKAFWGFRTATAHFRLLQGPPFSLGLRATIAGRTTVVWSPGEGKSYPASFSVFLDEAATAVAQRGVTLEVETFGEQSAKDAFVYYPVIPPVIGGHSFVDGRSRFESGYGGYAVGGLPVWVHGGKD